MASCTRVQDQHVPYLVSRTRVQLENAKVQCTSISSVPQETQCPMCMYMYIVNTV